MSNEQENVGTQQAQGTENGNGSSGILAIIDVGMAGPGSVKTGGDEEITAKERNQNQSVDAHKPEKHTTAASKTESSLPPHSRTKSNQRWMKLRTTVQLSGAIQKTKPSLKREDSFLKRFSTRQVPELQETMDTGDDGEGESSNEGWESRKEKRRRRRRKRAKHSLTVVNPDSDFYYYWLLLVTSAVLYNLWTLIVRQSFPELQQASPIAWFTADTITDITFYLDIIVQFRTGYLEQGLMVYNSRKLSTHYVRSKHFALDVVAITPIEYIYPLFVSSYVEKPILRFPRFLKVYRLYQFYYFAEARTVYPNVYRVVNLIHILLLLAHWFGCFYYLISEAGGFKGYWAYPQRPGEYETLARKYLGSLYWSTLTLTTIGDLPTPETNTELILKEAPGLPSEPRRGHKSRLLQFESNTGYIFTIVSYLIGVFIFATIVGQVGNVITNRNANRLEFERLLDGAKTYMRHHKVPGGMKRRVLRWYDYSWSRGRIQGGGDINTALGLLPDKLKTELALHVNLSVLKKVTIFQECQPEFLHDLVLKMKAYIFTPGDLICRKGEVAREMFIIADGILEVISETGRVMTSMQSGDFFGEIGILNLDGLNKRTADVRSVGYSELFSLSREDVLSAMKDYPEAQEILQNLGRKRLAEARNMNKQFRSVQKKKDVSRSPPSTKCDSKSTAADKNIVEKIRSDVKNALKISRKCSRAKPDSLELVPLTKPSSDIRTTSAGPRGTLCRMSRIYNDNNSIDDDAPKSPVKLGAGLPLLQRLKLLKEKQDQMKKENEKTSPVTPIPEDKPNPTDQSLPLLQRIKLLKQKEDMEKASAQCQASTSSGSQQSTVRTQMKSPFQNTLKVANSYNSEAKAPIIERKVALSKMNSLRENAEEAETEYSFSETSDSEKWKLLQKATVISDQRGKIDEHSLSSVVQANMSNKKGSVSFKTDTSLKTYDAEDLVGDNTSYSLYDKSKITRQNLFEGKRKVPSHSKTYRSIDDLSPEYSGLPFVKKLKILNERQKLAELEKDLAVRSSSLDSGGDIAEAMATFNPSELTRSVSEAVAIEVVIRNQQNRENNPECRGDLDTEQSLLISPPGSPESYETMERRKLKSILKHLSSGSFTSPYSSSMSLSPAHPEFKQLIRAQTVEGYVARHSKFTKCVTFSHVDTPSPPISPRFQKIDEEKHNTSECDLRQSQPDDQENQTEQINESESPEMSSSLRSDIPETINEQPSTSPGREVVLFSEHRSLDTSNQSVEESISKSMLEEDIGDLVEGIETVVNDQIEEIQCKFENQFASMTSEILKRDRLIADLRLELLNLKQNTLSFEDDFSDNETDSSRPFHPFMRDESVVTVVGPDDVEEELDTDPLQERLRSESSGDTLLEMGSDSEYSSDDDEDSPYDNQWEFKLLAEELDKREAAVNRTTSHNSHWQATSRRFLERRFGLSFQLDDFGDIPSRSSSVRVRRKEQAPFLRSSSVPESSKSSRVNNNPSSSTIKKTMTTLGSSESPTPSKLDFYDSIDSSFL